MDGLLAKDVSELPVAQKMLVDAYRAKMGAKLASENRTLFLDNIKSIISAKKYKEVSNWDDVSIAKFNRDYPNPTNAFAGIDKDKVWDLLTTWQKCSDKVKISRKNPEFLKTLHQISVTERAKFAEHLRGKGSGFEQNGAVNNPDAKGGHLPNEADQKHNLAANSNQQEPHMKFFDTQGNQVTMAQIMNNPANVNANGVIKMPKGYTLQIAQYKKATKTKITKDAQGNKVTSEVPTPIDKDPREILGYGTKPTPDGQTFFPASMSEDEIFEQCASAFVNPNKSTWKSTLKTANPSPKAESESGLMIKWWQSGNEPTSFFPEF